MRAEGDVLERAERIQPEQLRLASSLRVRLCVRLEAWRKERKRKWGCKVCTILQLRNWRALPSKCLPPQPPWTKDARGTYQNTSVFSAQK